MKEEFSLTNIASKHVEEGAWQNLNAFLENNKSGGQPISSEIWQSKNTAFFY
jgi:hypothetical protein